MTFEEQKLRERVLRTLLKMGRQNEGKLAALCFRRMFDESWNKMVEGMLAEGLIAPVPTGYARSRFLELTSLGAAEAEAAKKRTAEEVAAAMTPED